MKKRMTMLGITVCVIALGIIGVLAYQENIKQKEIETQITRLTGEQKEFFNQTNRDEKKELLKSIWKEQTEYNKSQKKYAKVSKKYNTILSDMQRDFISEYDQILKENTIENLDEISDITIIEEKKDKLDNLANMIDSEKDYVFANAKDYQGYQSEISGLVSAYTNRIGKIEEEQKKAEEEAKKKAEEEEARKKAEEEKAKTHYENEYFSIDVPESWNNWSVTPGENTRHNSSAVGVYNASSGPGGGGADIYVLEVKYPETTRLGYGDFALPAGGSYVGETSNGQFVFIMTEAGAGFFSSGATITLK